MTEPKQKTHRLFVACELPDDVKRSVAGVIADLRAQSDGAVRWVNPESLHVTLKFLGEVPERQIPAVKVALQEAVVRHSPFFLEFASIGTFRRSRRATRDVGSRRRGCASPRGALS